MVRNRNKKKENWKKSLTLYEFCCFFFCCYFSFSIIRAFIKIDSLKTRYNETSKKQKT